MDHAFELRLYRMDPGESVAQRTKRRPPDRTSYVATLGEAWQAASEAFGGPRSGTRLWFCVVEQLLQTTVSAGFTNTLCADCCRPTTDEGHGYVLRDALWAAFGVGRDLLCLHCLERRMGRFLMLEDFQEGVPLNEQNALVATLRRRERRGRTATAE